MVKQRQLLPCWRVDACGSSDAVVRYFDDTTNRPIREHCFSCGKTRFFEDNSETYDEEDIEYMTTTSTAQLPAYQPNQPPAQNKAFEPIVGTYEAIPERGLTKESCKTFGIQVKRDPQTGAVVDYIFNYYNPTTQELVAQKLRSATDKKNMKIRGDASAAGLFGQQAFPSGGKYITVVVGEFDAPSAYQMFGSKWPVVSIKNGDAGAIKELRQEHVWKWLNTFDNIVLAFDADKSGQEAVQKIIENKIFDFQKLRLMKMRKKDANEYLVNKMATEFQKDFWDSNTYIPKNIVRASELKNLALQPQISKPLRYMWDGLNKLLHGIFTPQLISITAGSGVGKSTTVRTLMHHVLNNTPSDVKIGALMLEEPVRDTIRGLMTISLHKNLNLEEIPDSGVTVSEAEKNKAFDDLFSQDRFYLYGDFGSNLIDQIVTDVTYMAKGLGCKYIFLDHVSIIVASQENGDERKALDEVTVRLRELCHTLDIAIFLVCHTKRVVGKAHEEGGQTSLSDLRGTAGIGQMSDVVLGLERNGQHPNPFIRDTTIVRVLKNRRFGRTGPAAYLKYTHENGTLVEIDEMDYLSELDKKSPSDGKDKSQPDTPVFDATELGKF